MTAKGFLTRVWGIQHVKNRNIDVEWFDKA